MKKSYQMAQKLEALKNEGQNLLDENKLEEAKAKMKEVNDLKEAINLQKQLEEDEECELKNKYKGDINNKTKESANAIRAMIKKATGKNLSEAENALLLPSTSTPNGENGEGYILPQDIRTKIFRLIREYKSFRSILGYIPTTALTGSFPVEDFETVTELIDFTDGTDGTDSDDIQFKNIKFALKEKAAFIKLSNTLLKLSDENLVNYVAEIFARKAVITENKMAINVLKSNKTTKVLAGWEALKSSINKDLDPGVLLGTLIVTNQDGFDVLDSAKDATGRPILQPNPTDPTKKKFNGYDIEVFSNALLPNNVDKAPIIYGNLAYAVKFVDLDGQVSFATSEHAGFYSNTTVARLIEFVDVIQCDKSDKCYVYGELSIPSTMSTQED